MISPISYIICLVFLLGFAFVVFRVYVRRDYQKLGRLAPFRGLLEGVVWVLFICFPFLYNPVWWMLSWSPAISVFSKITGLILVVAGIIFAFYAMGWLGVMRSFGQRSNGLRQTGLYRFTRNPQIVGGALMILGECLLWPSWYSIGWAFMYGVVGHLMVITEEEYLLKSYGQVYEVYCQRVPRYIGFIKRISS